MKISNNGIGTSFPEAHITRSKSKSRGRLKIYQNNTVYLDEGEEFEIEVFNPTQKTVLAKIEFNGEMISHSGLVLRPAQRVFLERFFDDNRKFKFEVYEVENTDKALAEAGIAKVNAKSKIAEATAREKMNEFLEGKALEDNILAIENLKNEADSLNNIESELNLKANQIKHATEYNGDLKVFFFNEKEVKENPYLIKGGYNPWDNTYGNWYNTTSNVYHTNNTTFGGSSLTSSVGGSSLTSSVGDELNSRGIVNSSNTEPNSLFDTLRSKDDSKLKSKKRLKKETKQEEVNPDEFFNQSLSMEDIKNSLESLTDGSFDDTKETGRIGQGGLSEQSFKSVDMDFEQFTFHSIEYKILPTSNKPIETSDLKQYCCQCGKKLKKTDKFCSNCGTKVD